MAPGPYAGRWRLSAIADLQTSHLTGLWTTYTDAESLEIGPSGVAAVLNGDSAQAPFRTVATVSGAMVLLLLVVLLRRRRAK